MQFRIDSTIHILCDALTSSELLYFSTISPDMFRDNFWENIEKLLCEI